MPPRTSCLICFTPRSGSTLLADGLAASGLAGKPEEYFLPRAQVVIHEPVWHDWLNLPLPDYLRRIVEFGTTPNGVFAAKCQLEDLETIIATMRQQLGLQASPPLEVLASVFPQPRFVWVTRRDKIRQAVSNLKARQTQKWMSKTPDSLTWPTDPKFNFTLADQTVGEFVLMEAAWAQFFSDNDIKPFTVVYEDLVQDYDNTIRQVLTYLSVDVPADLVLPEPRLEKQADATSEEWVQRYRQRKAASIRLRQASVVPYIVWNASLRRAYVGPGIANAVNRARDALRRRRQQAGSG